MDERKYGSDYVTDFDPDVYLKSYYSDISGDASEAGMLMKMMANLHDVYSTGDIKGRHLLDIGSGPTIHSVISAAPHCDSIFLSDFTPRNLETLEKWLNGELGHDFHKLIAFALDLEKNGETVAEREKSMREKISGIFPLDLLQDKPFQQVVLPAVDIVTSSLCLEAVARDLAEYQAIARRISKMVKVGGHVVLAGVLGESFYLVGALSFHCLRLTAGNVQQAWRDCGFRITNWKEISITGNLLTSSDLAGVFLMTAQKCSTENI